MPRAGLTTLRVVQEAEEVADEVGLTNLTLAAIAPRLGVRMPSLYKHVAGIDALHRLVAIRACHELADVLARAAAGKAGAEAVLAMATAYRIWANEHPGRYAATVHWAQPGDTEHLEANHAIVQIAVASLASYKLTGDDAIDAIRAIRATVHGFVSLEQANGFGLSADVDRSFDRLIMGLATTLDSWSADQSGESPTRPAPNQPTTTQGATR